VHEITVDEAPYISIIVPNFNQARFLEEALESIVEQKRARAEVIVIDGGSKDSSIDVIRRYEHQLCFWCSEPDGGHYNAVNKGMKHAKGEILAFLNSDDLLFPGALRIVGDIFAAHPDVAWLTSLLPAAWDVTGNCIGVSRIPGYSREAYLDGAYGGRSRSPWFIQQESTFWRRTLWEGAGGRIADEISHAGDFELWGRFFAQAELYGVNAPLGGFRVREGQRVAEGNIYSEQCHNVLQQHQQRAHRSPRSFRSAAVWMGLFGVKVLGGALRRTIGYRGKRIVRHNPGQLSAVWQIEDYQFP
jgi:glycosyltransferase involved in cell wall biosynthesis